jgi:hypothetical protein
MEAAEPVHRERFDRLSARRHGGSPAGQTALDDGSAAYCLLVSPSSPLDTARMGCIYLNH